MMYPITRLRRLRQNETIRNMVEETILRPVDLVMPLFVCPGTGVKNPIKSMPGNFQLSVDMMVEILKNTEIGNAKVAKQINHTRSILANARKTRKERQRIKK